MTAALLGLLATPAVAQTARERYESALERDQKVRQSMEVASPDAPSEERTRLMRDARSAIWAYHLFLDRFPVSGYSDNALFRAAELHAALFRRFGRPQDRESSLKLYRRIALEYPASSLIRRATVQASALEQPRVAPRAASGQVTPPAATRARVDASPPTSPPPQNVPARALLTDINRRVLPEAVRITLSLDREVPFSEERATGPARVFLDLEGVGLAPGFVDTTLDYPDDVVRHIRIGRHPNNTVRVLLDLEGVTRYSAFTLYNPFRLVIDCERPARTTSTARAASTMPPSRPPIRPPLEETAVALSASATLPPPSVPAVRPPLGAPDAVTAAPIPAPVPSRDTAAEPTALPRPPAANGVGAFSLARQLGLSVSRIVIDPGHGGRDPGAQGSNLSEAEITLDVALRLEKLLKKETGIETVLTRRTDIFVPLDERTAIANRASADLFLSIHANASRNGTARGVETYFLSFASSPEAEAVAARENAGSERAMHNLPEIVRAIALNNKLDESRDFATMVQESLVARLTRVDKGVRNLGVKKAPFVVLIGASMPSVLAEISFLSHKDDARLLKTGHYRERIAEALHGAVMRYRRALKGQAAAAEKE